MTNATGRPTRNPFGVMDVPDPDGPDVAAFAANYMTLGGGPDDDNAPCWCGLSTERRPNLEGQWASRWNGGADPTIAGDAPDLWKSGAAVLLTKGSRVFIRFDWSDGARRGLIEAVQQDHRLVGKYINLTNPAVIRTWVGLVVGHDRIDGVWTGGRLDFRR
jgi:hypothetical protein